MSKIHPMFAKAAARRNVPALDDVASPPPAVPTIASLALEVVVDDVTAPSGASPRAKRSRSPTGDVVATKEFTEEWVGKSNPAALEDAIASTVVPVALTLPTLVQDSNFALDSFAGWPLPAAPTAATDDLVPFAYMADLLSDISATSSRLGATVILAKMFYTVLCRCAADLLPVANLAVNRLAPAHEGVELGVGDAILTKAICESCGLTVKALRDEYQRCGDLAEIAQNKKNRLNTLVQAKPLTTRGVFQAFKSIATMSGKDTQRRRTDMINSLLRAARGPEVNFIVRALQGKMRIGIADSSVLMALGIAFAVRHVGGPSQLKKVRTEHLHRVITFAVEGVTRAFHEVPSFDVVLPVICSRGLAALIKNGDPRLIITPGIPVKPMLAHATNGITAILDRFLEKEFTCEYKYDGERAQVHYLGGSNFSIFSRNSERHTDKYPDVIASMPVAFDATKVKSFILDSEVVAIDSATGRLQAFQVLQHRGRKNIRLEDVQIEVCLFGFDLLYFNGESLLSKPLRERRQLLRDNFIIGKHFRYAESFDGSDTTEIQGFLDRSISDGCEGLMVKTLDVDADYTPFKRSYHWLKLKKDYLEGAGDTLDLIVMGGYFGKGKRTGVYGGYLLGCYDAGSEEVQSICKIGTGFSDKDLETLANDLAKHVIPAPPPYFRSHDSHRPDVWFTDAAVWEVKAADLTISPAHQAARGKVDADKGIALRFPRFLRVREDKGPVDATSAEQVAFMYKQQALAQRQLQESNGSPTADADGAGYE
jgi:DNA ligase-1